MKEEVSPRELVGESSACILNQLILKTEFLQAAKETFEVCLLLYYCNYFLKEKWSACENVGTMYIHTSFYKKCHYKSEWLKCNPLGPSSLPCPISGHED